MCTVVHPRVANEASSAVTARREFSGGDVLQGLDKCLQGVKETLRLLKHRHLFPRIGCALKTAKTQVKIHFVK